MTSKAAFVLLFTFVTDIVARRRGRATRKYSVYWRIRLVLRARGTSQTASILDPSWSLWQPREHFHQVANTLPSVSTHRYIWWLQIRAVLYPSLSLLYFSTKWFYYCCRHSESSFLWCGSSYFPIWLMVTGSYLQMKQLESAVQFDPLSRCLW